MRDIIFRGKRTDNGEWVYGGITLNGEQAFIIFNEKNGMGTLREVDPATVGQFTGLCDKNGAKIFEGDLIGGADVSNRGDVQFSNGVFGVEWNFAKEIKSMVCSWGQLHNLRTMDDDIITRLEVIGSVHDTTAQL